MPKLAINLLGTYRVTLDGLPVNAIESDKGRALLAYLAVESERPHSREALATMLWPETDRQLGRKNLRQVLYNLRQAIKVEEPAAPFLLVARNEVQFNNSSHFSLDVTEFQRLLTLTQKHAHRRLDACTTCIETLQQALDLYQAHFLEGFSLRDSDSFEEWRRAREMSLKNMAHQAFTSVATYYERRRDYDIATTYLQRQIELDPWREESHYQLMQIFALQGQRSAALNQYEVCRLSMANELGMEPSEQMQSFYQRILSGSVEATLIESESPYKGLNAFTNEDAGDFFGREKLTDTLVNQVHEESFIALIGPSGSGKSSVIQAGLVASLSTLETQLELETVDPSSEQCWIVVDFRPGIDPFQSLADALVAKIQLLDLSAENIPDSISLAQQLREGDLALFDIATMICKTNKAWKENHLYDVRLLLIADQFEELYTLGADSSTQEAFLTFLLNSVTSEQESGSRLMLLVSLRGDFVGQALSYRPLADAIQQSNLVVGPMNRLELEHAIVEPARSRGVIFQPGLVERLLDDVSKESGNLPLLQFALSQLWDKRSQGQLTHTAYEEIGGVAGALTRYADHVYWRLLDQEEREHAQRTFLRMVQLGRGTEDTRRVATRVELGEENWKLVQRLADARLVVTNQDAESKEIAELAHEALIHKWELFQTWLENDRTFRSWHQRLQAALNQWEANQMDEGALLRGAPLVEAEQWGRTRREDLSPPERAFIQASIALRDSKEAELLAQRQQALEQVRTLAAAESQRAEAERQRADAESQGKSRFRLLAIALTLVLVLAILATGIAADQRSQSKKLAEDAQSAQATAEQANQAANAALKHAEEQAQLALSRQLAAQSLNMVDTQLDLALLLSLESLKRAGSEMDIIDLLTKFKFSPFLSTFLHGHTEAVYHLAFDSDNQRLVSVDGSGTILSWDDSTGALAQLTLDHETTPDEVTLSPNGQTAVAVEDSALTLWDLNTLQPLAPTLTGHNAEITTVLFSTDSNIIATNDKDGRVLVWNAATDEKLGEMTIDIEMGIKALNPDGSWIILDEFVDGEIRFLLWDLASNQPLAPPIPAHASTVHEVTFSPDGERFASASFDGTVRLWDAATGEALGEPLVGHDGRVLSVAFSPDGRILASGATDNKIILWDTESGTPLGMPLSGHNNWVRSLSFSPDGNLLASADESGNVILWDMGIRQILDGHKERVRDLALSPDGGLLVTGSFDLNVGLWDGHSGELLDMLPTPHQSSILSVAFSPDGKTFATGDARGTVVLWDANTRQPRFELDEGQDNVIVGLAFSPDGTKLASGDFAGTIAMRDVATGKQLLPTIEAHEGWTLSLAFSPDGQMLASGGSDAIINLWDAATLQPLSDPLEGHSGWVTSLAYSPDGETLASGSSDQSVRLWDSSTGQQLGQPLVGHDAQVWSAQFNPPDKGRTLVTLGSDGSVLWWDVERREPLAPPMSLDQETESMAVSPDGEIIYFGTFNNTALMQQVPTGSWQERACMLANRNLNEEEWRTYLHEQPYAKTCIDLP